MIRQVLIIFISAVTLSACNKATEQLYGSHDNVYLDLQGTSRDSMLYTFAYEPARVADTQFIPVRISGIRQNVDRKFILKVLADSSTAQADVHYQALKEFYILPKDSGSITVPIIIYNTDSLLESRSVKLVFKLFATGDFDVNLSTLITGKLVFSNKLERPAWWGMWFGDYYSQVKHQFFLITSGLTSLSTSGLDAPKNLYFVSLVNAFISDPAKWISRNLSKGYVLTPRDDGDYNFYNNANPAKTILYHYDTNAGQYFFIDEKGMEVN